MGRHYQLSMTAAKMPPVNVSPCVMAFMQVSVDIRKDNRSTQMQTVRGEGASGSKMALFVPVLYR